MVTLIDLLPALGREVDINWLIKFGIGVTVGAASAVFIKRCWVRLRHLPPGPWGVPYLGASLDPAWHLECMKMRGKYGDIHSFYIGNSLVVMLNGYNLIKEALLTREHDFADRPPMNKEFQQYYGEEIFMARYNEDQRRNKKFALRTMKMVGMGQKSLEEKMLQEIQTVGKKFQAADGDAVELGPIIYPALTRVTMSVVCNLNYQDGDPEVELLRERLNTMFTTGITVPPFLFHSLPRFISRWMYPEFSELWGNCDSFKTFMKGLIEEHMSTFDPDNLRDVIDIYLKDRMGPDMDLDVLARTIIIFTPDSIDTIGATLLWFILYMAHYPEIQEHIKKELDRVVGREESVRLKHRADLKYLEATILEVGRIMTVMPVAMAHKPLSDTTLGGYWIPKDSFVFPNLHSIHYDTNIFKNPETFDPELHFMNEKGDLINTEYALSFSMGRRSCPGIQFSKMQLYLYMATLLQQFTFTCCSTDCSLEPHIWGGISMGIVFSPDPASKVHAIPRQ